MQQLCDSCATVDKKHPVHRHLTLSTLLPFWDLETFQDLAGVAKESARACTFCESAIGTPLSRDCLST